MCVEDERNDENANFPKSFPNKNIQKAANAMQTQLVKHQNLK